MKVAQAAASATEKEAKKEAENAEKERLKTARIAERATEKEAHKAERKGSISKSHSDLQFDTNTVTEHSKPKGTKGTKAKSQIEEDDSGLEQPVQPPKPRVKIILRTSSLHSL